MAVEIKCRFCKAPVQVENVNLDRMLAKCGSCNSIFDISSQAPQVAAPAAQGGPPRRRERGNVPMPNRVEVEWGGSALQITSKWKSTIGCFFLFFALFWNGITWTIVIASMFGEVKGGPGGWFLPLFLTPFILVGLGAGYLALAFLLNRTVIKVESGTLSVRHGPLKWPGNREIETGSLEQLYCEEYVGYTKNHRPVYQFSVNARTRSGGKIQVVKGLTDAEQALFIEQELEKHLGIEDQPVRGEI